MGTAKKFGPKPLCVQERARQAQWQADLRVRRRDFWRRIWQVAVGVFVGNLATGAVVYVILTDGLNKSL